jgi:hypothetical protein
MANCKQVSYTPQEFRNMVDNHQIVYTIYPDQSQSITSEYLEDTPKRIQIGEVTNVKGIKQNVYVDIATGAQILENRVTDEANRSFRRQKGATEADRISNLPDNVIKRDTGTFVHSINQQIALCILEGGSETWMNKIRFLARDSEYHINAEDFEMLRKGVQKVITQIKDTQDKINKASGTEGKVKIYLEHLVMDPERSIGGTMDIVALFSDNTASIYDYKTMRAHAQDLIVMDNNVRLINDLVPMHKYEGFTMQLGEYQRILTQRYGVKSIRESRIVPIMVQNDLKQNRAARKEDGRFDKRVTLVQMGSEVSEFLEQIAINESMRVPGLDKLIQGQMNIVERLREQVKTAPGNEREAMYKRITTITRGLNSLMIKRDISSLLANVYELAEVVRNQMAVQRTMPDGSRNPEYMTIQEMIDYEGQLNLYREMVTDLNKELKEDEPGYQERYKAILFAQGEADKAFDSIRSEIQREAISGIEEQYLTEDGKLKPQISLDTLDKTTTRHSQIENVLFKKSKELFDQAYYRRDMDMRRITEDLEDKTSALFRWAKENGLSHKQAYMKLVNMSTGNMHPMLVQKFWDERKEALASRDVSWMKAHYKVDREKVGARFAKNRKAQESRLKRIYHNAEDLIIDGKVVKKRSATDYQAMIDRDMKEWDRKNDLLNSPEAWLNPYTQWQLNLKQETINKYKSDEYKYIESNKPLKDYYDMYNEYNKQFAKMMGFSREDLPSNFIPWIRKDVMDRLIAGGFSQMGNSIKEMIDSLKIREDDIYLKGQDLNTGEMRRHLPVLFYHPLKNEDGTKAISEKSFDLTNVMVQWAKVAYNYQHMSEIEGTILAMKEYIGSDSFKEYQTNSSDKKLLHRAGGYATKQVGAASDAASVFGKQADFHMYGIRYGEGGVLDKGNTKKILLTAKNWLALNKLGFGFFPGFAAGAQGHISAIIEAKKGQHFDMKQYGNVVKMLAKDTRRMRGAADFFHVYAEDRSYKKALELAGSKLTKIFSSRFAFFPIRLSDESVDDVVLWSMMQNYGLDTEGNLARLVNLPKGSQSILELTSMDKDGKFKADIQEHGYIQFRNAVREVAYHIKGTMNDEDIAQFNVNLAMSMAMQFKTWIPGVLEERFGKLSYSKTLDAVNYGRFRAYFSEYEHIQGASWVEWFGSVVLPNMGKLLADIGTFGLSTKMGIKRVNEKRAKDYFDRWRIQDENQDKMDTWYRAAFRTWKNLNGNPKITFKEWISSHSAEANAMIYKEFLDAKQAQIKAMVNEIRIILAMMSVLALMGAKGDDDDNPWYYDTWAGRTMNKSLSRALSELAFVYNPTEFIRLTSSPFPALGILGTAMKTTTNTFDEMRDLIFGENSSRDITPWSYYSSQFVPGIKQLAMFFEFYEQNKKNPYTLGGQVR